MSGVMGSDAVLNVKPPSHDLNASKFRRNMPTDKSAVRLQYKS
jgi:hypothetical protein